MKHATIAKVNGNANLSRKTLERNLMDYLTCATDMDFEDALETVETATYKELVSMAVQYLAE